MSLDRIMRMAKKNNDLYRRLCSLAKSQKISVEEAVIRCMEKVVSPSFGC